MWRSRACRSSALPRKRSPCSPTKLSPTRRRSAIHATWMPQPTGAFTLRRSSSAATAPSKRRSNRESACPRNPWRGEMTVDVASSVRKMFVDGSWVESESGQTFDAISPATGETIAQVPKGTRAAARRAMAGLKGFARSGRLYRIADAIERRRDELAHLLTLDQGKPMVAEALGEV